MNRPAQEEDNPLNPSPVPSPSDWIDDRDFTLVLEGEFARIHQRRQAARTLQADGTAVPPPPNTPLDTTRPAQLVGLAFSGGGIRSATFNLGVLQRLGHLGLLPMIDYLSTVSGGGYIGGWWSSWMTRQAPRPENRGRWMPPVECPSDPSQFDEPPAIEYLRLYGNYLIPRKGFFSSDTWRAVTVILRNFVIGAVMLLALGALPILLADAYYAPFLRDFDFLQGKTVLFSAVWHAWLRLAIGFAIAWALYSLAYLFAVAANWAPGRSWLTVEQSWFSKWFFMLLAMAAFAGMSYSLVDGINGEVSKFAGNHGGWWPAVIGVLSGIYSAWRNGPVGGGEVKPRQGSSGGALASVVIPFVFLTSMAILLSSTLWLGLARLMEATAGDPYSIVWTRMWQVSLGAFLFALLTGLVTASVGQQDSHWQEFTQNSGLALFFSSVLLFLQWLILVRIDFTVPHPLRVIASCFLMAMQIAVGFGWSIDPNALSMHGFYRARLVRAYLGASNQDRLEQLQNMEEDVTESDSKDDLPLHKITAWENGGPLHVVNTTLNLVGASDLSMEQRQAEVFMLTPLHSGSYRTGYRTTSEYLSGTMTLGTAVSISGAAASPAMGPKTSAPLGMLMTFFNARLGYWIANPSQSSWRQPWTWLWPIYLAKEFLGRAELGSFCLLSDGGHLENLGLYSLVKRKCDYIIVCDAGADPQQNFGDLGNALRMIHIDFGCEVTGLDLTPLRKNDQTGISAQSYATGTIHYADGSTGTLIYIKSSLCDLPPELLEHYRSHPVFPHETTADQFFDEAQFESYRHLGAHIAGQVFAPVAPSTPNATAESVFGRFIPQNPGPPSAPPNPAKPGLHL